MSLNRILVYFLLVLAVVVAGLGGYYLYTSNFFGGLLGAKPNTKIVNSPSLTDNNTITQSGNKTVFLPSANIEAVNGDLVESYLVIYTLRGKVTKISSASKPGTYNITITSFTGSQKYELQNVGGAGILKKANAPMDWKDLKEGSDILLQVNRESKQKEGTTNITVAQIQVVAAP